MDEELSPFCGDSESGPGHLEGRFAYAVEGAAYVPGRYEAGCVGFFGLFQGVDKEQRCTVCSVVGAEPMLGGVEEVMGFPCVADSVGQYARPKFAEDFQEADWSEIFYAGEFFRFGEGN